LYTALPSPFGSYIKLTPDMAAGNPFAPVPILSSSLCVGAWADYLCIWWCGS